MSDQEQHPSVGERIDENKDNITLIWLDPNIDSSKDVETAMKRLREINDYVIFYTELDQCLMRIQSIQNEKIFLITSDVRANELLPSMMNLDQVDSIFIFSMNKCEKKHSLNEYVEIVDIYENLDSLCLSIEEQIKIVEKKLETFSIFDQCQNSTTDLTKQSVEFIWFQLLKNVIDHFPRNQHSKKQIVNMCRSYYRSNSKELKRIDEFDQNYRSELAIQWFSKKSFIYKLINKALRTKDINQLYHFQFFINDLSKNIDREHQKIVQSTENIVNVYRGVKLSSQQINQFKENQGKIISTNGYLFTSRIREKALAFATKPTEDSNVLPVLFEIECHVQQLGNKILFANIAEFSDHPDEKEVLFDLGNAFRLESVEQDGQVWLIKMNLSNDRQTITHDYIEVTRRETDQKSEAIIFGRLMCQLGHYDKSQRYFEQLLIYPNNEDISWIEFNLDYVAHYEHDLRRARELYDQAYDRMMHENPPRIKDSAYVLNNIGNILEIQAKYDQSRQFYQRALKIRETYCPIDHPDIAISLKSIGSLLYKRQKYNEALDFFQRALKIQEKYYSVNHPDIAYSLNLIGKVLHKQGKNSEALKLFQRALKIQEEYYPTGHPDKIESLTNIAATYEKLNVPRMALVYYKRVLAI
jgi:tetratricopeptide (TPR) repeat protein